MSNIDLFDYDKTIDLDIASTKYIEERKRSKSFESVFEDTQYPNQSSEAFTPVLPSVLKMGKLFKLRSSSQSYNKSVLLMRKLRGVAFIPLVTSVEDIEKEVKTCFGSDLYKRMVYNYIVPKRFKYKNVLMPGSKTVVHITDLPEKTTNVKTLFPNLQNNIASFYIKNNKNTIFDNSDILSLSWPTPELLSKPNVLKNSTELILQMIHMAYFGNNPELLTLYQNYQTSSGPIDKAFDTAFISIPIKTKNMRIPAQYMDPKNKMIPNAVRKNVDDSMAVGLMKFIMDMLDNNPFEDSMLQRILSEKINKCSNFIFFIHNDTHGFYIDPIEFKEKGLKYDNIYRLVRTSLKALIGLNSNSINVLEVDKTFNENEVDQELESKLDEALNVNDTFDTTVADSIGSSTNTPDNVVVDKTNVSDVPEKSVDKETSELNKTLNAKFNLQKADEFKMLTGAKSDADNDALDDILNSLDDIDFDNMESLDSDDELSDGENSINATREFMNELQDSNDEYVKQKIIEQVRRSAVPKRSAKEEARLEVLKNKYKTIKFDDRTFEEILNDTTALQIDLEKKDYNIKDKSFCFATMKDMTKSYVNKTMSHDMVNIIKSFSDGKSINMHITGFEKQDISDQFNSLDLYTFELEGEDKKKHKIKFKFPKVDDDGFMYLNGNKKVLKKQWILKPITKTSPDEVYLVSEYNKVHIFRQGKALSRNSVALKKLLMAVMSDQEKVDTMKIYRGDNSSINSSYITTIEYDELAQMIHKIEIISKKPNVVFYMNQKEIRNEIELLKIPYDFKAGRLPIGIVGTHEVIDVDPLNSSDSVAAKILSYINEYKAFTDFDEFIKTVTVPKRKMYTMIEIQSRKVPLIVFLSSLYRFEDILAKSQIEYFVIDKGEPFPEDKDITKYSLIRFRDKILYYNQYPIENALLLNGLAYLDVDNIDYEELNDLGVYLDYIFTKFKVRSLYKGWTAFHEMFLTPIAKEVLRDLGQPTDFLEVFLYANSLLADNSFLPPNDARNYRIRDFEMLNSYLYSAVSKAYVDYKQKGKQRFAFTIPEDEVLKNLNKSLVLENYDTTNPLNELMSKSTITFKGPQGVNSDRAFKLDRRGQTRSVVGTVGISSPENGTVGIVRQLTVNPRVTSTRGYLECPVTDEDANALPVSSLLTPTEAALPYITKDDPKRIGFASAQTKHVIPAADFDFPVVGTGFEKTVIDRVGDTFGYKSKKNGVVTGIDEVNKFVVLKYDDGTSDRIDYGDRFVRNSDFFLPNNLELNVKVGDKVKKGDIVTYNKDFFKKHMGQLAFTQGTISRVAILEGEMTEEDSSCISQSLSKRLAHSVIKRKQIVLGAMSNIVKSVEEGDFVRYGDPLLIYEDQKDSDADMSLLELLGTADDSMLNKLTRHKGEANYTGHITEIKVYWSCDPEKMSESARAFVKKYIAKVKKQINFEEKSSGVKSSKRSEIEVSEPSGAGNSINGAMMPKDGGILVEYYIKHEANKRGGDKITVNSSLKSVITQVVDDDIMAKRCGANPKRDAIGVIFSLISVDNRMVTSIWHTGYLQKLLIEYPKRIAEDFLKEIE